MRPKHPSRRPIPTGARPSVHRRTFSVIVAGALSMAGAALAGPLQQIPIEKQCLKQLIEENGAEIDCVHQAWFTDQEREDVKKLTRGYLLDASCDVTVKIARKEIEAALASADMVFTSPAQPMTCSIETSRGTLKINGTFSPRVVFKGGAAVEASPGLGDITGVNSYLAWPVVHYINFSERITKPMLLMINAYRSHRAPQSK